MRKKVGALKSEKQAARQEVQRLRGHLGALKCAAKKRGQCRMIILKARPDRCEEIETLKLQIVGDRLHKFRRVSRPRCDTETTYRRALWNTTASDERRAHRFVRPSCL